MSKVIRYGLMIVVIAVILYLVAHNFDDIIYSFSCAVSETREQEERSEDVFGEVTGQGVPEDETVK